LYHLIFKKKLSPFSLTTMVGIFLIPCAVSFFFVLLQLEQKEQENSLENRAQAQFQILQSAFVEITAVLQALRSVIELKPDINSQEFDAFVASQTISDYGISAFEWIPKISVTEHDNWVKAVKEQGLFDFKSAFDPELQDSRIEDIFPIRYSSSNQMQGFSLGKNLAQDPANSALLLKSLNSASMQLMINQSDNFADNSRFILPAYTDQSFEPEQLLGFVAASINFEETINILLGNTLSKLNLCLHVQRNLSKENLARIASSDSDVYSNCPNSQQDYISVINYAFAGQVLVFKFYDKELNSKPLQIKTAHIGFIAFIIAAFFGLYSLYQSRKRSLYSDALIEQEQAKLYDLTEDYSQLFKLSLDGIYKADFKGNLSSANPAFAKAFGYSSSQQICKNITTIQDQLHLSEKSYQDFLQKLLQDGQVINFEWLGVTVNNQPVWLTENAYLVKDNLGNACHYQGFISIITERKLAEQNLKYQADHDSLTGLRNRASFVRVLDKQIKQRNDAKIAIFFIDIDRFKSINDSYGHAVGDELLIEFSRRLTKSFETAQVARFGGDEFALFLPDVLDREQLIMHCDQILQTMRPSFQFSSNRNLSITASIGASLLTQACDDVSQALLEADLAMYDVKHNGRNNKAIYSLRLSENIERRLKLEVLLKDALENQEFYLVYQPIIKIKQRQLAGFETLVRWFSPALGEISPVEFIPILEELNLIDAVGAWIMDQAIKQLIQFNQVREESGLFINVNVSPKQLISHDMACLIKHSLARHNISARQLNIEVTETQLYCDGTTLLAQLHQIKAMGVGIYIDDFGTGHSSLERLVSFPLSGIKLDQSFISALQSQSNNAIVLKATIHMAELLGLSVTVEGIEQEYQHAFFKELQCQHAQGYLYNTPLLPNKAIAVLLQDCNSTILAAKETATHPETLKHSFKII